MAGLSPSGSAGGIVEITSTAIAAAQGFVVTTIRVNPGSRSSFSFPDNSTNISFQVRQAGKVVRFFSSLSSVGYYTTSSYSSGSVNTKGVTFCWESDSVVDIELTYWGMATSSEEIPFGLLLVESGTGFLLLETGDYLSL